MQTTNEHHEENGMDGRIHEQLPALLELAHNRSDEGKVVLAGKLAEIFLTQAAALTAHEERLVIDLINDLLQTDNETVRRALIDRFAAAVDSPRPVAMRIVMGPIEIARSALIANENLSDDDLVLVVESQGKDHATAIAQRRAIGEAVADALVATGDLHVMQLVAENMGAKLSTKAIDLLVDAARLSALLQKPILSRPELGAESASRLFWWVAKDLRRATLERFGFGPGKLEACLNKAVEENLNAHLLQKDDGASMQALADWLEERETATTRLFPQLLRMGHYKLFNILLSRITKIALPLVASITMAPGGLLLVALCRAIGIDKGNFVSVFLMSRGGRPGEQIVHPRELSQALAAYDHLAPEDAKTLIESWQVNDEDLKRRIAETATIGA